MNEISKGGAVDSWNRAVLVRALTGCIVLCSWARHFTLTVPLYTHLYKWVQAKLMLGVTLRWTSIAERSRNTPRCIKLKKPGKTPA